MIEFVTTENVHHFNGNPLAAQHKLRYESIILRQKWDVPFYNFMEFDQYDNPAAKYLVYRDENGQAKGVSRFYPTTLPYMLEEKFAHFVKDRDIPKSEKIWEGSRFCIDHTLPPENRKRIIQELVIGYLESALHFDIEAIVGLMYPAYWRGIFTRNGWNIEYMCEIMRLEDGNKARSAWLPVSEEILKQVREKTGIYETIVDFGVANEKKIRKAA